MNVDIDHGEDESWTVGNPVVVVPQSLCPDLLVVPKIESVMHYSLCFCFV